MLEISRFFLKQIKHMPQLYMLVLVLYIGFSWVSLLYFVQVGVETTIEQQSSQLLGGQLRVRTDHPLALSWKAYASDHAINQSQAHMFRSMVSNESGQFVLALVKAVDDTFPLTQSWTFTEKILDSGKIPLRNQVWLTTDAALALGASLGDYVDIGYQSFEVTAIVLPDLEQMGNWFEFSPRLYINLDSVESTRVIQPGSLTFWHWYFTGPDESLVAFKALLEEQLSSSDVIETQADSQFRKNLILDRIFGYLHWFGMMNMGLLAVMLVLLTQRYVANCSHWMGVSVAFGVSASRMFSYFAGVYFIIVTLILMLSLLTSVWLYQVIADWFFSVWSQSLSMLSYEHLLTVSTLSMLVIIGLALPMLLKLSQSKPTDLMANRDSSGLVMTTPVILLSVVAMAILFMFQFGDFSSGLVGVFGWALVLLFVMVCLSLMLSIIRSYYQRCSLSFQFAFANLRYYIPSYRLYLTAVIASLSFVLTGLVLTQSLSQFLSVHHDNNSPNYFVINIAAEDQQSFKNYLDNHNWSYTKLYPAIRGRLIAVNGEDVEERYGQQRIQEDYLLRRPLNLSASDTLPIANEITAGTWHEELDQSISVSVSDSYAKRFDLQLGDRVSLRIGDRILTATIASLRAVDWYSFQPNFFMIFHPSVLEDYPATWLTSFYVPSDDTYLLTQLVKQYPNLTLIHVGGLMLQLNNVIDYFGFFSSLVLFLGFLFALCLVVGVVRLQAKQREKDRELIKKLGGPMELWLTAIRKEIMMMICFIIIVTESLAYIGNAYLLRQLKLPVDQSVLIYMGFGLVAGIIMYLLFYYSMVKRLD